MNNEIQRIQFENKRINHQLDTFRTQFNALAQRVAELEAQLKYNAPPAKEVSNEIHVP